MVDMLMSILVSFGIVVGFLGLFWLFYEAMDAWVKKPWKR